MELLAERHGPRPHPLVTPVITADVVAQMTELADEVHVDPAILAYVAELAEESRRQPHVKLGLSVRGCLALIRVAKTWAAADGRDYVVPDDIKDAGRARAVPPAAARRRGAVQRRHRRVVISQLLELGRAADRPGRLSR